MSKDDIIQRLLKGRDSDYFGLGRLRQDDRLQWLQLRKAEMCRLKAMSHGQLEHLYHLSEGLCEAAE